MTNTALDLFNPTCPEGAKWYACPTSSGSSFAGCCKTDPCTISGCALGNLASVSFNASAYGTLPDPSCGAASTFYSCVAMPKNTTTFWGCCKSNACDHSDREDKSCPKGDLTAALLDNTNLQKAYGVDGADGGEEEHSHTGVIVGSAVAGGVAVVAIIAILIYCLFKKRRARSRPSSSSSRTAFPTAFPGPEKTAYGHSPALSEAAISSPALSHYHSPKVPPFAAFGQHQYTQVAQELPAEPATASSSHQRYSELPAELHPPAELESPYSSPQVPSSRFSERIEDSPRTTYTPYTPVKKDPSPQ